MSKSVVLGDIASIITGPFGSQLHVSDYQDTGIPVIMPQNIMDRKVDYTDIACVSDVDFKRLIRYATQKNDIVFPRRGDIEKHAYITTDDDILCGTGCFRVRITDPEVYPLYVSMYLNRPESKRWLTTHAVGTNMPNLNTDIISAIPIELPDIEEQIKLADFIQSIEDKIGNNNTINNNLANQISTLYDYWFVQFDFPNNNKLPYRINHGRFVYNSQLKLNIPEEWEVIKISDITKITWGQCPDGTHILDKSTDKANTFDYCSGAGDMKGGFVVDCQAKTDDSRRFANCGDILLSIAGKIGDMCVVDHRISLGRAAMAFTCNNKGEEVFVYSVLKNFNKKITTISSGSIQKVINKDHIDELFLPYNKEIVAEFCRTMSPLYNAIIDNTLENRKLTAFRDWLLPILMNGQANIDD